MSSNEAEPDQTRDEDQSSTDMTDPENYGSLSIEDPGGDVDDPATESSGSSDSESPRPQS